MRIALALFLLCAGVARADSVDVAERSTVIVFGHLDETKQTLFGTPVTQSQDNYPYCSGVLIAKTTGYDVVVTARHCVTYTEDGGTSVDPVPQTVKFSDGTRYRVLWYGYAQNDDIGVLAVEHTGRDTADIDSTGVKRAAAYFAFSMPNGYAWSYVPAVSMNGDKDSKVGDPWNKTNLFVCPGCGPGDSGGGLFNEDGALVGITVAGEQAYTVAVPSRRVVQAIDSVIPGAL